MITLLWTKSKAPLSKVIRWTFNEPVSHFAICFDHRIVFHSNLLGAQIKWMPEFFQHAEPIFELHFNPPQEIEDKIYDNIYAKFSKPRFYDFGAFAFFAQAGLRHKLFKAPMPSRNLWGRREAFLCTEMSGVLSPMIDVPNNADILTPYELYEQLLPLAIKSPYLAIATD